MTEIQQQALEALQSVECKMAEEDEISCGGPWCAARKAVLLSFGLIEEENEKEEEDVEKDGKAENQ